MSAIRFEPIEPKQGGLAARALATVQSPSAARLPQTYESAKTALANCASIDECLSWSDKAAALASYAKQANDDELMRMATRIRDRAIRRAGELLKQIEPARGVRTDLQPADGGDSRLTRTDAARQAGMSERQQVTAIRVANVSDEDFERQVESEKPPTVTALAEQGKRSTPQPVIDLKGRNPHEFNLAMHFVGEFEMIARNLAAMNIDGAIPILTDGERTRLRSAISQIDTINDRIMTRI